MTKLLKLENFLKSGSSVTARQISGMFGLQNASSAIYALRSKGVCVYANKSTLASGKPITKYSIGKPTKKMIAMAHALGMFA